MKFIRYAALSVTLCFSVGVEAASAPSSPTEMAESAKAASAPILGSSVTKANAPKYFGSYNQLIKADVSLWPGLEDNDALITVLTDTHHNLFGHKAQDGTLGGTCLYDADGFYDPDSTGGFDWCGFMDLLEKTKGSDLKIFAVLSERDRANRWLTDATYDEDSDGDGSCDLDGDKIEETAVGTSTCKSLAEVQNIWVATWKAAAKELSALSVSYPQLAGFTIDDFSAYVCGPDYIYAGSLWEQKCYAASDLAAIRDASHLNNKSFQFWPTVYYINGVNRFIDPGYAIGSPYGLSRTAGDYARLKITVPISSKPESLGLKFFHYDNGKANETDWGDNFKVYKKLSVNGKVLFKNQLCNVDEVMDIEKDAPCGEDYIGYFDEDIASYSKYPAVAAAKKSNPSAEFGTAKASKAKPAPATHPDLPVTPSSVNNEILIEVPFETNLNDSHWAMWYVWGLQVSLNGEPLACSATSTACKISLETYPDTSAGTDPIASSNDAYSVTDSIDGILAPYAVPSDEYESAKYRALLQSAKTALGDKKFLAVNYAMMWEASADYGIEAGKLSEQIADNAAYADGSVLWSPPLFMHGYADQGGVFAENPTLNANYELMAHFPGNQPAIEGWYQKWTGALSGAVKVKLVDNQTADALDGDGNPIPYFVKKIANLDTGETYYEDAVSGNEGVESVSFDLGATPQRVEISLSIGETFGNASTYAYFHVTDSADQAFDASVWKFESGTTEKAKLQSVYDAMSRSFAALRDDDGDGLGALIDPDPDAKNEKIWWVNQDSGTICISEEKGYDYVFVEGDLSPELQVLGGKAGKTARSIEVSGLVDPSKVQATPIWCGLTGRITSPYGIYVRSATKAVSFEPKSR